MLSKVQTGKDAVWFRSRDSEMISHSCVDYPGLICQYPLFTERTYNSSQVLVEVGPAREDLSYIVVAIGPRSLPDDTMLVCS